MRGHVESGVSIDSLERGRNARSAERSRLESNLPGSKSGLEAHYLKRRRSSLTASALIQIAAFKSARCARNILLFPLSLATGRLLSRESSESATYQKYPYPLSRSVPVSVESTSEKVLGGNIWKYPRRSQAKTGCIDIRRELAPHRSL